MEIHPVDCNALFVAYYIKSLDLSYIINEEVC
jgi:hypothetical protein